MTELPSFIFHVLVPLVSNWEWFIIFTCVSRKWLRHIEANDCRLLRDRLPCITNYFSQAHLNRKQLTRVFISLEQSAISIFEPTKPRKAGLDQSFHFHDLPYVLQILALDQCETFDFSFLGRSSPLKSFRDAYSFHNLCGFACATPMSVQSVYQWCKEMETNEEEHFRSLDQSNIQSNNHSNIDSNSQSINQTTVRSDDTVSPECVDDQCWETNDQDWERNINEHLRLTDSVFPEFLSAQFWDLLSDWEKDDQPIHLIPFQSSRSSYIVKSSLPDDQSINPHSSLPDDWLCFMIELLSDRFLWFACHNWAGRKRLYGIMRSNAFGQFDQRLEVRQTADWNEGAVFMWEVNDRLFPKLIAPSWLSFISLLPSDDQAKNDQQRALVQWTRKEFGDLISQTQSTLSDKQVRQVEQHAAMIIAEALATTVTAYLPDSPTVHLLSDSDQDMRTAVKCHTSREDSIFKVV